ncbi:MAG: class II fumarate hydratase [Deltaproteobacteria bacterium]|nr:class II fumarate hydratase [Deltaproteobacteria bacterium]
MKYRIEKDSMGKMKVPVDCLYGASTQRAVENFPVSGWHMPSSFIHSLGYLKACCAVVNKKLKLLDGKIASAIQNASLKVAHGEYDLHFVVDVFQTGSGTSTNMNANEVIANIANLSLGGAIGSKKPIHPNDHVNLGQSSNDVIPSVIHIATFLDLKIRLIPELKKLQRSLEKKSEEFKNIVKIGRTHLQDATPITLGQEFSGYAAQIKNCIQRIESCYCLLSELALGGTAVGTGINTHKNFSQLVCEELNISLSRHCEASERSRGNPFNFIEAKNHFEAQASKDTCLQVSGSVKTLAVALTKIANDIRWLSSGPRCGLGEIEIPSTQPGSSIMPGKVNPVIAESVLQVCAQVIGNDTAITLGAQAGNFELNVMMPMIACNLLNSISLLSNVVIIFRVKCIDGIKANKETCENSIEKSLALCTALVLHIGYDKAAELAKKAYKTKKTIRQICQEEKILDQKTLEMALNPWTMLKPID